MQYKKYQTKYLCQLSKALRPSTFLELVIWISTQWTS